MAKSIPSMFFTKKQIPFIRNGGIDFKILERKERRSRRKMFFLQKKRTIKKDTEEEISLISNKIISRFINYKFEN